MQYMIDGAPISEAPADLVTVARLFVPIGCTLQGFVYDEGIQSISYFTSDGLLRQGTPAFSQGFPILLHNVTEEKAL